jgi:hypothetical protein
MKWMNTGESDADARRFRLSNFLHKCLSILVIHLKNQAILPDFLFIPYFAPHSTARGTDPHTQVGSVYSPSRHQYLLREPHHFPGTIDIIWTW